jgi:DNA polymerase-3 subunit epsilon
MNKLLKLTKPLIFFDLETTGTNTILDKIIQFCGIKYFPNRAEPKTLELFINPGFPLPKEIIELTKITDEKLKGKKSFREVASQINEFIFGCDLAGFNIIKFDVPMLKEQFKVDYGMNLDLSETSLVDIGNIFKKKEERTLAAASRFYLGKEHKNAHNALDDTKTTAEVFYAQLEKYSDLPQDIKELAAYSTFDNGVDCYDLDGKIAKGTGGVAIYNFGKNKGIPVNNVLDYARWMLKQDFSDSTKGVINKIIAGEIK